MTDSKLAMDMLMEADADADADANADDTHRLQVHEHRFTQARCRKVLQRAEATTVVAVTTLALENRRPCASTP